MANGEGGSYQSCAYRKSILKDSALRLSSTRCQQPSTEPGFGCCSLHQTGSRSYQTLPSAKLELSQSPSELLASPPVQQRDGWFDCCSGRDRNTMNLCLLAEQLQPQAGTTEQFITSVLQGAGLCRGCLRRGLGCFPDWSSLNWSTNSLPGPVSVSWGLRKSCHSTPPFAFCSWR